MAVVKAHAFAALGSLKAEAMSVEITHYLWLDWARIAQTELLRVREIRANLLRVHEAGGDWAPQMEQEHTASLITISACAHALDGIYGELKSRVAMPALGKDAGRHDHIRAALAAAFRVSNGDGKRWRQEFTWLHDLRDAAVHPVAKSRPTVAHPIDGSGSYEAARYCLESCERAMALLLDILRRLARPDQVRTAEVRAYTEQMAGVLNILLSFT